MKLYTCGSGVWLNNNGRSFEAWTEDEQNANPQDKAYYFEIEDEKVEILSEGGYRIKSDDGIKFTRI